MADSKGSEPAYATKIVGRTLNVQDGHWASIGIGRQI